MNAGFTTFLAKTFFAIGLGSQLHGCGTPPSSADPDARIFPAMTHALRLASSPGSSASELVAYLQKDSVARIQPRTVGYQNIPWGPDYPIEGDVRGFSLGGDPILLSVSKQQAIVIEQNIAAATTELFERERKLNEAGRENTPTNLKWAYDWKGIMPARVWQGVCSLRPPTIVFRSQADWTQPLLLNDHVMLPLYRIQLHMFRGWLRARPHSMSQPNRYYRSPLIAKLDSPSSSLLAEADNFVSVSNLLQAVDHDIALLDRELARLGIDPPAGKD